MCRYFTLFKPQHQGHGQYSVHKVSNVPVFHSVKPQHQGGSRSVLCAQGQQCAGTSLCLNHSIRVTVNTLCARSAMCWFFTWLNHSMRVTVSTLCKRSTVMCVLVLHSVQSTVSVTVSILCTRSTACCYFSLFKPQHQGHRQSRLGIF